jgi:nucleotide-binding universal stress UspA family protein
VKNILLLIHDDVGQEARLQAALDLTRALDGHLTCVDVVPLPVIVGDFYGGASSVILLDDNRQREVANRKSVEARLSHEGVSWDWKEFTGDLAASVVEASDLADLIVVNRRLDEFPYPDMRHIASSILTRTNTPLVAVPDSCSGFDASGRALIAWNGSEQVAATMQAAVPLLQLAASVQLFEVDEGKGGTPVQDAAAYLSRHGIHPTIRRMRSDVYPVDAVLRGGCAELKASYCVMGAFGRSPLVETVFGGVTRKMLSTSKIPLVLGH